MRDSHTHTDIAWKDTMPTTSFAQYIKVSQCLLHYVLRPKLFHTVNVKQCRKGRLHSVHCVHIIMSTLEIVAQHIPSSPFQTAFSTRLDHYNRPQLCAVASHTTPAVQPPITSFPVSFGHLQRLVRYSPQLSQFLVVTSLALQVQCLTLVSLSRRQ